MQEERHSNN